MQKTSKCLFGVQEVEYLGHSVSHEGVQIIGGETIICKTLQIFLWITRGGVSMSYCILCFQEMWVRGHGREWERGKVRHFLKQGAWVPRGHIIIYIYNI